MSFLRRTVPAALGVVTAAALLAGGSAGGATVETNAPTEARAQVPTTVLTVRVVGCESCEIGVDTYRSIDDYWDAKRRKEVRNGRVIFKVPTEYTPGLTINVSAPWEGGTGYRAGATLRYGGAQVGDAVGFDQARAADRATPCWAGSAGDGTDTLRIKVRRVTVQGYDGPTAAVMAWAPRTEAWLPPMYRALHGVLGSQEVMTCEGQ